jgi:hypothetical protein
MKSLFAKVARSATLGYNVAFSHHIFFGTVETPSFLLKEPVQ